MRLPSNSLAVKILWKTPRPIDQITVSRLTFSHKPPDGLDILGGAVQHDEESVGFCLDFGNEECEPLALGAEPVLCRTVDPKLSS